MNRESQSQLPVLANPWAEATPFRPPSRFDQATHMHTLIHRCTMALRRRWWILLLCALFIGVPAVYLAMTRPPTFQSHAIMWMTGQLNLPEGKLLAEELTTYMDTQAELIKSDVVQFRACDKVRSRFSKTADAETNTVIGKSLFALTVHSSTKGSVLDLTATGPSPEATRAFLDAVMDEYLALKKDSRKQTSFGALSSITDQINNIEKQVQQHQNQLTLFQMSNNISYLAEHGLSAGSHLAKLVEILSDLRTEFRLLELLTPAQFKGLSEGSQATISDMAVPGEKAARALAMNTAAPQLAHYQALQQVQILKAKRDEFAQVLRPTHSKMVKLNQEIAGLEQLLKTLQDEGEQRALTQMENRKKSLELQIQNLESQYRAWETNAAEASRKLAEYDRMKQDMQRSQALYDRLLSLLQTVDLNKNLGQEPLTPLGPASLGRPTFTKYKVVAAGIFLSFIIGGGLLLLLEVMDDRFTSVDELRLQLPDEIVGQIPESSFSNRKHKLHLLENADERHAFAESFRNLRSFLLFMFDQETKPKVILITSAVPREGKTTVATNLAAALAQSGARVLLVDADLRRSSLHKLFDVSLKPGLREVLTGLLPASKAIVPVSIDAAPSSPHLVDPRDGQGERPFNSQLFLLPAGKAAASSSEMFLRSPLDQLFHDLAVQFDYVVIDAAPVLAVDDATSLGPMTDGVFMVVRASHTSSRMTTEALDRLHKRRVKVLGVIYNRAAPGTDYYYRYSSHYRDGSDVPIVATLQKG